MTPTELQTLLQSYCDQPLFLKVNENHSTMCSIRKESHRTKISLNRIFLKAPLKVICALTKVIKRKNMSIPPEVKAFIHQQLHTLDYSTRIDTDLLEHQGCFYNLKVLYDNINCEYFNESLNLHITWFDHHYKHSRSRLTFGLYYDTLKLIKINRLLDSHRFPEYVIKYVIYHEMLHHVSPAYVDQEGVHRPHHQDFKMLERKFKDFSCAKQWIKNYPFDFC